LIDGKYELVEIAGEGGMATVFRAVVRGAAGFQRTVAIKRIRPEFRALRNYIDMFIEEARVGSELAHPNIVQVHDFCSSDGAYYLIMEWVDGIDLGTMQAVLQREGKLLPWPLAVAISIGALRGLGAAHDRRASDGEPAPVIHRDVSPHNILIGANGVVKLTDFGLARARDRAYSLTMPGTVKGKLSYLAPEVTLGKPNSVQSDLFSMGVVMWEMLCGQRLFDARNDLDVFKKIRACVVPPLRQRRPDAPEALAAALDRALSLDPRARYGNAGELILDLGRLATPSSVDAPELVAAAVKEARALRRQADSRSSATPSTTFDTDFASSELITDSKLEESLLIEISVADLDVEPLPLNKPKR
jgi:eukaryotic-like serine/threonine-protein kinase